MQGLVQLFSFRLQALVRVLLLHFHKQTILREQRVRQFALKPSWIIRYKTSIQLALLLLPLALCPNQNLGNEACI